MEVLGCIIKQIKLKLIDNKLEYKNNIYTECIDIFNDIAINLGYTYSVHNIKEKSSNHIVYTVIFDDNKTDIIPAEMFAKLKIEKLKERKKQNNEVLKLKEKNRKNLTREEKYKIYYNENQEKIRNKQKEYYQNNKEMFANNYKEYAEKHREQMLENKKQYMKLYREVNKEKIKSYYKNNKEKYNKKKED
jgi:hypothetical protein